MLAALLAERVLSRWTSGSSSSRSRPELACSAPGRQDDYGGLRPRRYASVTGQTLALRYVLRETTSSPRRRASRRSSARSSCDDFWRSSTPKNT